MFATRQPMDRRRIAALPARRILTEAAAESTEFAASYLQIARLLLAYGRTELARRRLRRVVDRFGNTPAAAESLNLLSALDAPAGDSAGVPLAGGI
jgi:hypothetical protein